MRSRFLGLFLPLVVASGLARGGDLTFSLDVGDRFAIRGHDGTELFRVDESGAITPATVYASTIVVGPVGTPQQNGTALRNVLQNITGASETSPWLVKVEPGFYDTGSSGLFLKDWVHLEGSGEAVTVIQSTGDQAFFSPITLEAMSNTEARFLTLRAFAGVADRATAFQSYERQSVRLLHVTLFAHSENTGSVAADIYLSNDVRMRHVNAQAEGGSSFKNVGIVVDESINVALADVRAIGVGSASENAGILVYQSPDLFLRRVFAAGAGGSTRAAGVASTRSTIHVLQSEIKSAFAANLYGIYLTDGSGTLAYDVRVEGSILAGDTTPINASERSRRLLAHTRLEGGTVTGANLTCAFVHDENFVAHTSTCP